MREQPVEPGRDTEGGQDIHAHEEPEINPTEPPAPEEERSGHQTEKGDDDYEQGGHPDWEQNPPGGLPDGRQFGSWVRDRQNG